MNTRVSPDEVAVLLEGLGACAECVAAARLLDREGGDSPGSPEALAAAARRALGVHWVQGGRTPAAQVIEAVIALAGDARAIIVAAAAAFVRLRAAQRDPEGPQLAREALVVWAPVASRFGLGRLSRDIEDLAFKIAERPAYDAVARLVALRRADRDRAVEAARSALADALADLGVTAEVTGRAKHLWSIHQKLRARGDRQPKLYDLFGLRVIVDDDDGCYEALGAVHAAFTPLPERFKDYIARPKPNGYRSLHTVVRIPSALADDWVEVQIRSRAMHALAEHGAAAHMHYKHPELARSGEEARWIYALTPRGEVRRLPRGATPLDFAYAIHTDLGHGCTGAKVNRKLATLITPLCTGDVVEILHSSRARPSERQISRVRTARARNGIRAALHAAHKVA